MDINQVKAMVDGSQLLEVLKYQNNRSEFVLKHYAISSVFALFCGVSGALTHKHQCIQQVS